MHTLAPRTLSTDLMETSTTARLEDDLLTEDSLNVFLGKISSSDVPWMVAIDERDKRVGAVLRERHYFHTSEKPHDLHLTPGGNEEEYWRGQASMYPGYQETLLRAALTKLQAESSTAALTTSLAA